MTSAGTRRRRKGEPVAAIALPLASWMGLRAAVWETPFALPSVRVIARSITHTGHERDPAEALVVTVGPGPLVAPPATIRQPFDNPTVPAVRIGSPPREQSLALGSPDTAGGILAPASLMGPRVPKQFPLAAPAPPPTSRAPERGKRWHLDAWAAWRPGAALPRTATGAPLAPAYGGSQAGALARFDLGPGAHPPALYLRATHAPDRPRQSDLAAGISIRPFARVPARLWGEARATRGLGGSEVRPAVMAVSELPRIDLPGKLTADGYLQAGWVGGRDATGFVDGQARVERIFAIGPVDLAPAAGVWGGAQKYAERLDVGPSLGADLRRAGIPLRLTFDYRFRVAGDARPGNGPAITLSTGF